MNINIDQIIPFFFFFQIIPDLSWKSKWIIISSEFKIICNCHIIIYDKYR